MQTLTYVSTAKYLFDQPDLEDLLKRSRKSNREHGITGLLLYDRGTFMQTIEGKEEAIRQLFINICKDDRHHGVIKLVHHEITERIYPDWSMGFRNGARDIEGFNDIFATGKDCAKAGELSYGQILLSTFHGING